MLDQILHDINNYFVLKRYRGEYEITNGEIILPFLQEGQYFRINGSVFNDGVHRYPEKSLINENKFEGEIWAMSIPAEFLDLVNDIEEWQKNYGSVADSPYNSESFGGYSYSKASGGNYGNNSADNQLNWQSKFRSRLNRWRKI